jgi:thermolabile hemolysin
MPQTSRVFLLNILFPFCLATAGHASSFSALYVFGDSLSDVGNLDELTNSFFPGPSYFDGRVSNGPVFVETLSVGLGLGTSMANLNGGTNFAFAGARTTGTTGIEGLVIQDVDEQVTSFLNGLDVGSSADSAALYMVFAGANDLVAGVTDLSMPVDRLETDIGRLYDRGARQFFVPNLPRLGLTPRFNDTANADAMNVRSETFNDLLESMLTGLEMTRTEIDIVRFDMESRFDIIANDPASLGFADAMREAAPGLSPGAQDYNESLIVPAPNTYLFWDDLHPTAAGHALLAKEALRALMPVPEPGGVAIVVVLLGAILVIRTNRKLS